MENNRDNSNCDLGPCLINFTPQVIKQQVNNGLEKGKDSQEKMIKARLNTLTVKSEKETVELFNDYMPL